MKKTKSLIVLASMLALGGLAGCGEDGPKEVTLKNISISGLSSSYSLGSEIEWNQVSVKLNYSDNSTVSIDKLEFDVETAKLETTEAIVYTSGLYGGDTSVAKEYQIKVSLKKESFAQKRDVMTVTIEDFNPAKYPLVSFVKPNFVNEYEQAIKPATPEEIEKDPAITETKFVNTDEMFTIGTLNTFKFQPTAIFLNSATGKSISSVAFKKDVVVQELNELGEVKKDASPSDYVVKPNGIKFNESAIGKSFKLTEKPSGYTKDAAGKDVVPVSFSFKVEKGVNITNALELGLMNLIKYTAADFVGNCDEVGWNNHLGVDPNTGYQQANGAVDNFYDAATNNHVFVDEVKIWKDFLLNKGVISAADFDVLKSAPNFFITNKITIKPEDIPQEYFITEAECSDPDKYAAGGLRDGVTVYKVLLDQDVTLNGNYFTIDASNIPLCKSNHNGGWHVYDKTTTMVDPGHATLFEFDGISPTDANDFFHKQEANAKVHKGIFKNFNAVGNTKPIKEQSEQSQLEKMMNLTGLIFTRAVYCNADFDNVIAKQFMIGIFADKYLGQMENGSINPAFGTYLKNSKVFDCANSGVFNYNNGNFVVSNSTMKRFGGGCIINVGDEDPFYSGNTSFDSSCVLENYVSGSELYFVSVGASGFIPTILAISAAMKAGANSPFANEQGLMNLVSLSMEGDYLASDHQFYYSNVAFNADAALPFISNTGADKLAGVVDNYMLNLFKGVGAMGTYAPVGLTENGDLFFVNPYDSPDDGGNGYYVYTMTTANSPDWYKDPMYGGMLEPYYMTAGQPAPYKYVDRSTGAFTPVTGIDPASMSPIMAEERTIDGKYLSMFVPVPNSSGGLQTTLGLTFLMPTK